MKGRQNWRTPKWLFDALNAKYGPFTLDAAADYINHLCDSYYSEEHSGLLHTWHDHKKVFVNPPFTNMRAWVDKALYEHEFNNVDTVMIAPGNISSSWFHRAVNSGAAQALLPNKRIAFVNPEDPAKVSPDRDSIILHFNHGLHRGVKLLNISQWRP
jgi:phage N-6-adenine-methyltransferase